MRIIAIVLISLLAIGSVAPAFAEDEYFIEIGGDTGSGSIHSEWEALVANNKPLLRKLRLYPKNIMQGGEIVSTRMQAGPIADKSTAQRICRKLFKQDIPCFVMEGLADRPPSAVISMTGKAGEAIVPVEPFPWMKERNEGAQPEVDVAEAIRVPLTENTQMPAPGKVTMKPLSEIRSVPASPPRALEREGVNTRAKGDGEGWLTVSSFANDEIALAFWDDVRSGASARMKNLRLRIVRPLMSRAQARTTIMLGPFASEADAYAFCHDDIQAVGRGLSCSFEETTTDVRRAQLPARRRPSQNPMSIAQVVPNKQYWVQLISASSQLDALRQWDSLKSGHADLLKERRAGVSNALNDPDSYVMRVGPITDNAEAVRLCEELRFRGVSCRVLLFTSSR